MMIMNQLQTALAAHLLGRVRLVQENLGQEVEGTDTPEARFGEVLDSMGMVEFLALVAEDCGVPPEVIEQCAGGRFGTIAELAISMEAAGLGPAREQPQASRAPQWGGRPAGARESQASSVAGWLTAAAARLPDQVQPAAAINAALQRPAGWLESRAGIVQRRLWADQDPLAAAATAGRDCLDRTGLLTEEVGALLVTSEAPPLLAGLAAALHHRLDLRPETVALEVGGACTGFLAALWTARALLPRVGAVLVLAIEASTRYLQLRPGPAGEAAALFGDGAAACLLCDRPAGPTAIPLTKVILGCDGSKGDLVRVERPPSGPIDLRLEGVPLASQAVRVMARAVHELAQEDGLGVADLKAVVAHGGNGRLPALLARKLGLPAERVWSETASAGNLGAASLPVAWAAHPPVPPGPVVWTAVGAGLTWAAALLGIDGR
jgi:3-oxoacyl-[acyl-carrier-protein] synthase-3